MFKGRDYLIGSEISLLDCCILPILWRLESLEIELPKAAATIQRYMDFHFSKDYFRKSLSKQEQRCDRVPDERHHHDRPQALSAARHLPVDCG